MMFKTHINNNFFHELMIYIFAIANPLFLPFGLFYTHLYSPVAFYYIGKWSLKAVFFLLSLVSLALTYTLIIVFSREIHLFDYVATFVVLFASIIFAVYVYLYIARRLTNLDGLMIKVIKLKFALSVIAVVLLFSGFGALLWTTKGMGEGINRLQMFFYEPSIYALVASSFVIYAITRFLQEQNRHTLYMFFLAIVPLLLSKSAGVIGAIALAVILGNFRFLMKLLRIRNWFFVGLLLIVGLISARSLIDRYEHILEGRDKSGAVRVVYSLSVAKEMIEEQGMWLGVGPGQLKFVIEDYTSRIAGFGGYRLPNSIASTIGTVGVFGLTLKLVIMVALFFLTKSHKYKYSKTLFLFVFIYQFTGGYFVNVNEYVPLAFAFGYARYRRRKVVQGKICKVPPASHSLLTLRAAKE